MRSIVHPELRIGRNGFRGESRSELHLATPRPSLHRNFISSNYAQQWQNLTGIILYCASFVPRAFHFCNKTNNQYYPYVALSARQSVLAQSPIILALSFAARSSILIQMIELFLNPRICVTGFVGTQIHDKCASARFSMGFNRIACMRVFSSEQARQL